MADGLSSKYLREFLDPLGSRIERTEAVYHASDLVGLEIYERRLYACACLFITVTELASSRRSVCGARKKNLARRKKREEAGERGERTAFLRLSPSLQNLFKAFVYKKSSFTKGIANTTRTLRAPKHTR